MNGYPPICEYSGVQLIQPAPTFLKQRDSDAEAAGLARRNHPQRVFSGPARIEGRLDDASRRLDGQRLIGIGLIPAMKE